jgi:hypothetical protein
MNAKKKKQMLGESIKTHEVFLMVQRNFISEGIVMFKRAISTFFSHM